MEKCIEEYAQGLGGERTVEKNRALWGREGKTFLVVHENRSPAVVEVRTDVKLGKLLIGKYESVMRSRYYGKGGIEVVCSGQLSEQEILDLVRLSWELSV